MKASQSHNIVFRNMIGMNDYYIQLAAIFGGGSGNPFEAFSHMLITARRALLATGGVSVLFGSQTDDMQKWLGNVMAVATGLFRDDDDKQPTEVSLPAPASSSPPTEPAFA
jgi:aspartate oxidase